MMNRIAFNIRTFEEFGIFTLWARDNGYKVKSFRAETLYRSSTIFIVNSFDKTIFPASEKYCLLSNIPVLRPIFKINSDGDVDLIPYSNEREIYYTLVESLNKYLKYLEHNKSNLSQDEKHILHDILSVMSMSLDNCE